MPQAVSNSFKNENSRVPNCTVLLPEDTFVPTPESNQIWNTVQVLCLFVSNLVSFALNLCGVVNLFLIMIYCWSLTWLFPLLLSMHTCQYWTLIQLHTDSAWTGKWQIKIVRGKLIKDNEKLQSIFTFPQLVTVVMLHVSCFCMQTMAMSFVNNWLRLGMGRFHIFADTLIVTLRLLSN